MQQHVPTSTISQLIVGKFSMLTIPRPGLASERSFEFQILRILRKHRQQTLQTDAKRFAHLPFFEYSQRYFDVPCQF